MGWISIKLALGYCLHVCQGGHLRFRFTGTPKCKGLRTAESIQYRSPRSATTRESGWYSVHSRRPSPGFLLRISYTITRKGAKD